MKKLIPILFLSICILSSCEENDSFPEPGIPDPVIGTDVVSLPVVVHVIHEGEAPGVGSNLSTERIKRQIEILNEDFRRKPGTRGYNEDPREGDTLIEFVLADYDPSGNRISGLNRINKNNMAIEDLGYNQNHYAQFAYWNPWQYINIWTTPLPPESVCIALGISSGPETDLPGTELLSLPTVNDAEGILINYFHFGESDLDCIANFGRTLTHEMGHFLGLLHTWGGGDCAYNDYCDDTPAVDKVVYGKTPYSGCNGETIMIGNYMNYSDDDVMNIFTQDQIARMHYVLKNHEGRNGLVKSGGIER